MEEMPSFDTLHSELQAIRIQQHADMAAIVQRLSAVEALVDSEGLRCPYREEIARASNNKEQINRNTAHLDILERDLATMQVKLGGIGATMGAVGAVITSVVMKALGQ